MASLIREDTQVKILDIITRLIERVNSIETDQSATDIKVNTLERGFNSLVEHIIELDERLDVLKKDTHVHSKCQGSLAMTFAVLIGLVAITVGLFSIN